MRNQIISPFAANFAILEPNGERIGTVIKSGFDVFSTQGVVAIFALSRACNFCNSNIKIQIIGRYA